MAISSFHYSSLRKNEFCAAVVQFESGETDVYLHWNKEYLTFVKFGVRSNHEMFCT